VAQAETLAADIQPGYFTDPQVAAHPPVLLRLISQWSNEDILKGQSQFGGSCLRPAFAASQQQQQ
jgi:hypothetical protein